MGVFRQLVHHCLLSLGESDKGQVHRGRFVSTRQLVAAEQEKDVTGLPCRPWPRSPLCAPPHAVPATAVAGRPGPVHAQGGVGQKGPAISKFSSFHQENRNAATRLSLRAGKRLPLFVFLVVEAFVRENRIPGY